MSVFLPYSFLSHPHPLHLNRETDTELFTWDVLGTCAPMSRCRCVTSGLRGKESCLGTGLSQQCGIQESRGQGPHCSRKHRMPVCPGHSLPFSFQCFILIVLLVIAVGKTTPDVRVWLTYLLDDEGRSVLLGCWCKQSEHAVS